MGPSTPKVCGKTEAKEREPKARLAMGRLGRKSGHKKNSRFSKPQNFKHGVRHHLKAKKEKKK